MSPTPIIELQRRLTLVGEIRIGGEKKPRSPGAKLRAFRLTSQQRSLVEQAAKLYGGDVTPWESQRGAAWQVYTEASELPVLVMPGYSLEQRYEWWEGATEPLRVCDGYEEMKSGGGCLCASEGVERCDVYTRIVVALPELETAQGWRLITRGANAAHELPTMMRLLETLGAGQTFVPARLRVDERRGVKDGQVVRYVVPSLDLALGYAALAANSSRGALPPAESAPPVIEHESAALASSIIDAAVGGGPERPSPQLEQRAAQFGPFTPPPSVPGFEHVEPTALELQPNVRDEQPLGEQATLDLLRDTFDATEQTPEQPPEQTKLATVRQKKKLDVLTGTLRDGEHITTDGLYAAVAKRLRNITPRALVKDTPAFVDQNGVEHPVVDANGVLHWAPLRETLTRPEADQLIDWLEIKQQRVEAGV